MKTSACKTCSGSGATPGTSLETCTTCNGNGKVHETKQSFIGTFTTVNVCGNCRGRGKVPKEKCKICHGVGVMRQEEEITVAIPAGIEDGEMIRLSGAGEAITAGAPGDLYIKVHVRADARFHKEGVNLLTELSVKLSDALLGGEYTLPTLEGEVVLTIPPGVSHGEVLRVKGKGVPVEKGKRGDLLVKIRITLPAILSKEAKNLIEKLREEGI